MVWAPEAAGNAEPVQEVAAVGERTGESNRCWRECPCPWGSGPRGLRSSQSQPVTAKLGSQQVFAEWALCASRHGDTGVHSRDKTPVLVGPAFWESRKMCGILEGTRAVDGAKHLGWGIRHEGAGGCNLKQGRQGKPREESRTRGARKQGWCLQLHGILFPRHVDPSQPQRWVCAAPWQGGWDI